MYGIQGEFRRFCFDRAVLTFGTALENELESVEAKTDKAREVKRQRLLDRWLGRELRYRSPVATKTVSGDSASGSTEATEQVFVMRGDGSEKVAT